MSPFCDLYGVVFLFIRGQVRVRKRDEEMVGLNFKTGAFIIKDIKQSIKGIISAEGSFMQCIKLHRPHSSQLQCKKPRARSSIQIRTPFKACSQLISSRRGRLLLVRDWVTRWSPDESTPLGYTIPSWSPDESMPLGYTIPPLVTSASPRSQNRGILLIRVLVSYSGSEK